MRARAVGVRIACVVLMSTAGVGAGGGAVELQLRTIAAYDSYVQDAAAAFLDRRDGEPPAANQRAEDQPAGDCAPDGRIVSVPGGLVHHWRGRAHIPGADLTRVLAVARDYGAYPEMYPRVLEARVVDQDGDRFVIETRIRETAGMVSAVLELRSVVTYRRFSTSAHSLGTTDEVREVLHPGRPDERLLLPGRGSGYLWRANTFTRFVARDGGVDVELEAIGLSRRFPPLLGWLIEPIARRLGRSSVERTLREFSLAVRRAEPSPAPTP